MAASSLKVAKGLLGAPLDQSSKGLEVDFGVSKGLLPLIRPLRPVHSTGVLFLAVAFLCLFLWIRKKTRVSPAVGPQPPIVRGSLPFIGAGIDWLKNPKEFLNQKRKEVGDIFILEAFGLKLFFVFSPDGLKDFYSVPETEASFQQATRGFLGFKVPEELMAGTLNVILPVLNRNFQSSWLQIFNDTMDEEFNSHPGRFSFDIFKWTKKMVHKSGFRAWIGEEAVQPDMLAKITSLYESLDPEQGFTDMSSLVSTIVTRRSKEKSSLEKLVKIFEDIYRNRKEKKGDLFESLHEGYATLPEHKRFRQVAIDIIVIHMASQSNLFAAIAWTVINLILYPEYSDAVRKGNDELADKFGPDFIKNANALAQMDLLEQCFHESIRLAQQSLTLRLVGKPIKIQDYTVVPGYYIATLLSCLNLQQDHFKDDASQFLPEKHYLRGGKINPECIVPGATYAISTFGHGPHTCPGQRFAILLAKTIVSRLFEGAELSVKDRNIKIIETQMGAVGRPTAPVLVTRIKN